MPVRPLSKPSVAASATSKSETVISTTRVSVTAGESGSGAVGSSTTISISGFDMEEIYLPGEAGEVRPSLPFRRRGWYRDSGYRVHLAGVNRDQRQYPKTVSAAHGPLRKGAGQRAAIGLQHATFGNQSGHQARRR